MAIVVVVKSSRERKNLSFCMVLVLCGDLRRFDLVFIIFYIVAATLWASIILIDVGYSFRILIWINW